MLRGSDKTASTSEIKVGREKTKANIQSNRIDAIYREE